MSSEELRQAFSFALKIIESEPDFAPGAFKEPFSAVAAAKFRDLIPVSGFPALEFYADKAELVEESQRCDELPGGLASALYFIQREKELNALQLADFAEKLEPGGVLLAIGENRLGAKSFKKQLKDCGFEFDTESKAHCQIFFARKVEGTKAPSKFAELKAGRLEGGLRTYPGDFHWKSLDSGTAILLEHLPEDLSGLGVELGSASGVLSRTVLERSPDITRMTLVELFSYSVLAARENLEAVSDRAEVIWADALKFKGGQQLDFALLNPPRHDGGGGDSLRLGLSFIERSLDCLKKGGSAYVVVNRNLPYRKSLAEQGIEPVELAQDSRFEVFRIQKAL